MRIWYVETCHHHSCAYMNGNSADIFTDYLALAGMDANTNFDVGSAANWHLTIQAPETLGHARPSFPMGLRVAVSAELGLTLLDVCFASIRAKANGHDTQMDGASR